MFAPVHLTCPADVADTIRETRLRLHTLAMRSMWRDEDILEVADYLARLEEAVLEHVWTPDPDVDDEAVS